MITTAPSSDTPPAVRPLLGVVKLADWLSIWHRSHDRTDEMTEALALLPEISATLAEREPSEVAADLAQLLPEMVAAGARAVHDLGLITLP